MKDLQYWPSSVCSNVAANACFLLLRLDRITIK